MVLSGELLLVPRVASLKTGVQRRCMARCGGTVLCDKRPWLMSKPALGSRHATTLLTALQLHGGELGQVGFGQCYW